MLLTEAISGGAALKSGVGEPVLLVCACDNFRLEAERVSS